MLQKKNIKKTSLITILSFIATTSIAWGVTKAEVGNSKEDITINRMKIEKVQDQTMDNKVSAARHRAILESMLRSLDEIKSDLKYLRDK